MFLKTQHVQRMNSGGGVVFATGTPIANSLAETFIMKAFLILACAALQVSPTDCHLFSVGPPRRSQRHLACFALKHPGDFLPRLPA
jgi:hypothetical protein